jgi:quinohemoprotein ethanol dehydrogenase
MAWYYQTTPRDQWDFDAVQKFVLADLRIGGTLRHVIMQANKNGFFYVLDRITGALISAQAFTTVTWAKGVDPATGRPILAAQGDYYATPKNVYPSWAGGHTWSPMSFDPRTGLVYIPVIDAPSVWDNLPGNHAAVKYIDGFFTTNGIITDDSYDAAAMQDLYGPLPDLATLRAAHKGRLVRELLRAWDPVAQRTVWEMETSAGMRGYDGGVTSTAGNLVLQGRGTGALWIYAADTGRVLKVIETGSHIMAAPMMYEVGGVHYVAVQVGYGGTAMAVGAIPPQSAALHYENVNRIIAFRLDGGSVPKPPPRVDPPFPPPPPQTATAAQIQLGAVKFAEQCSRCHVFGPSITPDLRKLSPETHAAFRDIVLHGMFASAGMGRFDDVLSAGEVDAIHAYLIAQNGEAYKIQEARK